MFYDISPTAVCAFNESFNFKISSSRCSTKSGHRLGKQLCQKRVWFDICFRYISGSDFTRWPLSVKPTPRPLLSLSVLLRVEPGPCADCEPGAHGAAGAGAVSLRPAESLTPDFYFPNQWDATLFWKSDWTPQTNDCFSQTKLLAKFGRVKGF